MDELSSSCITPKIPFETSSAFVRPGSDLPTVPARTVEEVQHRIRRSCAELLRLERSIAFIGDNGNQNFDDTVGLSQPGRTLHSFSFADISFQDKLKKVLNIILPVVNSYNFREIDEAVKAMFEVLSPWSACAISDPDEDIRWKYKIHQCNLRLIRTLNPQLIAGLPPDQVDILDVYSRSAKNAVETGDMLAKIWANKAAETSQQAGTPVEGKLRGRMAALKRQVHQRSMQQTTEDES
jgi:hypothetical protein